MSEDEQQVRDLVSAWMSATRTGDVDTVLSLVTDDVVFLMPGNPPMIGKQAFAKALKSQTESAAPRIDGESEIHEIQVHGEQAFLWSKLKVTVTPSNNGQAPIIREGHTLSIFRKHDGQWLLARDANMLTLVK